MEERTTRKDESKQELAIVAMHQIQEAQRRGVTILYTDGSAELVGGVGWVAGYGCHEPGMWEKANRLPVGRKQTINRAELMAVIVAVGRTHTRQHPFAVATDSSYVYGGVQGAAIKWRAQQWVTNKGPVLNVDLWIDLLELLDQALASYEWIKVPSHVQMEGNERADALAELGRKSSPLYARAGKEPHVLLTPIVVSPIGVPDRPPSIGTGSALKFSVELTPVACDADLGFAQVTPAAQGGQLPSPTRQLDFDAALDSYTSSGAAGTLRSLGLQLIESPVTDTSSERSQSVACTLHFMDEDDLVTSADETVSMGTPAKAHTTRPSISLTHYDAQVIDTMTRRLPWGWGSAP